MKTSSKRRVLISSVAMLLVAMLALGTATFAWFTQNTEAIADGVYAKAVKASSLVISKADKKWATAITYSQGATGEGNEQVMFPASSGNGSKWYTANAEEYTKEQIEAGTVTEGTAKSGTISEVSTAAANAKYVYKEMLNVKNDGEGKIEDITISWNFADIDASAYARIALVPCDVTGKDLTTAAFTDQAIGFTNCVYDTQAENYNGLTGTATTNIQNITAKSATSIDVLDLEGGQAVYYNLYIWFEGQDKDCIDGNVGQTLNNLKFTVAGTPAQNA